MKKVKQNTFIGIATRSDLTDIKYDRAWKDMWLDPSDKIDSFTHADGGERLVFKFLNVFLIVAECVLAA